MQKFKKTLGALTTLLALGSILMLDLPSRAYADQITFGPSTNGIFTFKGNGANSVTVSTNGLSGVALFASGVTDLGTFTLGSTSFVAGPVSGGLFPTNGTENFNFISTSDSDKLRGTITWNIIQDDTPQPRFFGTLLIGAVMGDPAFTNAFRVGSPAAVDFTTNPLSSGGTLDQLAATTCLATATVSSGEVISTAPEPGSLILFGLGLIVLCVFVRSSSIKSDTANPNPAA